MRLYGVVTGQVVAVCLRVKMSRRKLLFCVAATIQIASTLACGGGADVSSASPAGPTPTPAVDYVDREASIPADAVKVLPETDEHPPVLLSAEFERPAPVPGAVNTAGAEDSPFITPDGSTLFYFFTPDVRVPVEKQLLDGVTGIYVANRVDGEWGRPERVVLQEPGKLALDGCEFVLGDRMWFCSAREGYEGIHWFRAEFRDGRWQDWRLADWDPAYQVGELHISSDGSELYFGSDRPGGKGQLDIWVSRLVDGAWQEPINVAVVNTTDSEGWPALNPDGTELWFYRDYGIWRSKRVGDAWGAAEQIVASLAGEPSIDAAGNLYFVHHYYSNDRMIEADIYVATRKQSRE